MPRAPSALILCLVAECLALPSGSGHWRTAHDRVVGGSDANISEYPYSLQLMVSGEFYCCASVIGANWVLTAGHCLEGVTTDILSFRAGTSTRDTGGTVHDALTAISHEQYNTYTLDYDIGVVQISGSFPLGDNVQTIGLPAADYDPPGGLAATLTGWGVLITNGPLPDVLQKVDVNVIDRETCQSIINSISRVRDLSHVSERMICAGEAGKAACGGDSGGPLVSGGTQIGIVSWKMSGYCEKAGSVYASVGSLRSWITSKTNI
ncbi:trypsin alpha-3-like [Schistocerca nitens]|uniref:trypsin alpha-3-like n=1 Tax=Schistocerca nitens TaxID=7011 RepID=UPI00211950FC|nr:trypsin alpha-3-like [Schistocerca nitens]